MSHEPIIKMSGQAVAYPVNSIHLTIQGEGATIGLPVVLVRLQGCDVGCSFCDTKETWELTLTHKVDSIVVGNALKKPTWALMTPEEIVGACRSLGGPRRVLLTGGEPARYDLRFLFDALHAADYSIILETSGTASGHLPAYKEVEDHVVVSPKYACLPLLDQVVYQADELKFVVGKRADIDQAIGLIKRLFENRYMPIISWQPMSQSEKATALCVEAVTLGDIPSRLSLQLHKYIGVA